MKLMRRYFLIFYGLILLPGIGVGSLWGEEWCQRALVLQLLESDYLPTSFPSLQGCTDLEEVNRELAAVLAVELLRPEREVDDGALVHFLEEVRHGYLGGNHRNDFADLVRGFEEALGEHGYRSFLDVSEVALDRFESLDPLIQEIRRETRDAWVGGQFRAGELSALKSLRAHPSLVRHSAASVGEPLPRCGQEGEKRHEERSKPSWFSIWGVLLVACMTALGRLLWVIGRRASQ